MHCRFLQHVFHDIDQFGAHLATLEIDPVQLSRGRLNLGCASLAFEDVVITRLDCNRKVGDRVHMDPSWLLLVVLLVPQRWGTHVAPAESLVAIAPDTEYRTSVPEGFRCVEAAIRLDLVDELGLDRLFQLRGAGAIMPIPAATVRRVEHQADRLLNVSASQGLRAIGGDTAEMLRQGCLDLVGLLPSAGSSLTRGRGIHARAAGKHRFALAEKALQAIEAAPVQQPPSVDALAMAIGTTRRTLLNSFQEALGTTPSQYILARRLNKARHNLACGESKMVTDAALDYGFQHFGRFACHYRRLFGETPSETLRRARCFGSDGPC